jgi:shikimate kinase
MRVILMGLRGCGKTTVGRELARRCGVPFIDLDEITPRVLACATAGEALRSLGEPAFRAGEAQALRDTLASAPAAYILALGGGTPTAPGAAPLLQDEANRPRSYLVYLHAPPTTLRRRLQGDNPIARPSLTGRPVLDEIGEVYAARDGLYRSIASVLVEVGDKSPAEVCDELTSRVGA